MRNTDPLRWPSDFLSKHDRPTAQQSSVGSLQETHRAVPAGKTFHYVLNNFGTGTVTGTWHYEVEERP